MTRILLCSLAWAAAIIGIAVAGRAALIDESTADTLVIVLPLLAVLSIGAMARNRTCGARS